MQSVARSRLPRATAASASPSPLRRCCCRRARAATDADSPPAQKKEEQQQRGNAEQAGGGALFDARRRSHGPFVSYYAEIELDTQPGISLHDLTHLVRRAVRESGVSDGTAVVQSRHTTVAVTVNEFETRLMDDVRQYLRKIAPASDPWLHNDLHLRRGPPDWPGGDEAWRAQEPVNAQAHVQAMLLGASAALAVVRGELSVGTWQSVIGVELDGRRRRRWGVAVQGLTGEAEAD